jgi:subtilisin family serine protease
MPCRTELIRFLRAIALAILAICIPAAGASARELLLPREKAPLAKSAGVSSLRTIARKSGKVKVIVGLRVPFSPEGRIRPETARVQRRDIASAVSNVKSRFQKAVQRNPKAFRSFDSVPFVAMEVSPEELDGLASDPNVISISEDRILKPFLAQSAPLVEADKAWTGGYSGIGQTIAIVDTGVDKNHPFLAGKVVSEACYSILGSCPGGVTASTAAGSGMPCSHSSCGHGTHVAGIAAGLGSGFSGVARNANIIAIQVFSNYYGSLGAYDSDLIAALNRVYALRNDFKIAAVNLSLGGGAYSAYCNDEEPAFTAAVSNLASVGIATIAASGNSYYTSRISYPACISSVISVGSVLDANIGNCSGELAPDKVACYSNSASFLSLLAPGSFIESAFPNNRYVNAEGTSMAAPHVAGAWAVLRQKSPNASISEIHAALQTTGKSVTDYRNGIVKKRINVKAALDALPGGDEKLSLEFTKTGTGGGSVSFSPAGTQASCSDSCSNSYTRGAVVTMAAVAAEGSTFKEWSGACSGAGACTVTMSQALAVSANFVLVPQPAEEPKLVLQYGKLGQGNGAVSFSPAGTLASCSNSCSNSFVAGTAVTLTASPTAGSAFLEWSGACSGAGACTVTMSQALSVNANFVLTPQTAEEPKLVLEYARLGPGSGTVTFSPVGTLASCDTNCSNSFTPGTTVTLTAAAAPGSAFMEWSGACSGAGVCTVAMSQAASVSGRFIAASDKVVSYTKAGAGSGTVSFSTAAGTSSCAASCMNNYGFNTLVTLRASPNYGTAFGGWSGACKGRSKTCRIRLRDAASVTATFNLLPVYTMNLTISGSGVGSVAMSAPDGVSNCTANCSGSYPSGTRVRLTATPSPGMVFAGWQGACRTQRATCTVTLRTARTVSASFRTR